MNPMSLIIWTLEENIYLIYAIIAIVFVYYTVYQTVDRPAHINERGIKIKRMAGNRKGECVIFNTDKIVK